MRLILVRHAETDWNVHGRLQGRIDIPLNERGQRAAASWCLPHGFEDAAWFVSPLARARETASIMGLQAHAEPVLVEMDWGAWEGHVLDELRRHDGPAMVKNEARGLDFRPKGGESPREVQLRVLPWLLRTADHHAAAGAVTHKGVIRAIVALAADWDMIGKPPAHIDSGHAHIINVTPTGVMSVEACDIPLSEDTP